MPRKGRHTYDAYAKAHEKDTLQAVRARRLMTKKLGHPIPDGMDVDHKRSIHAGGTNSPKNLRLRKSAVNRGDKTFYDHGWAKGKGPRRGG